MYAEFLSVNLAYISLLVASFGGSIIRLRTLYLLSSALFVCFGLIRGIPSIAIWNVVIALLTGYRLMNELRDRGDVALTEEEDRFRRALFPNMNDTSFHEFWHLGTESLYRNEAVREPGGTLPNLAVIIAGRVEIRDGQRVVSTLGAGNLLDVERLAADSPNLLTCYAPGPVWVREWRRADLARLAAVRPAAIVASGCGSVIYDRRSVDPSAGSVLLTVS